MARSVTIYKASREKNKVYEEGKVVHSRGAGKVSAEPTLHENISSKLDSTAHTASTAEVAISDGPFNPNDEEDIQTPPSSSGSVSFGQIPRPERRSSTPNTLSQSSRDINFDTRNDHDYQPKDEDLVSQSARPAKRRPRAKAGSKNNLAKTSVTPLVFAHVGFLPIQTDSSDTMLVIPADIFQDVRNYKHGNRRLLWIEIDNLLVQSRLPRRYGSHSKPPEL